MFYCTPYKLLFYFIGIQYYIIYRYIWTNKYWFYVQLFLIVLILLVSILNSLILREIYTFIRTVLWHHYSGKYIFSLYSIFTLIPFYIFIIIYELCIIILFSIPAIPINYQNKIKIEFIWFDLRNIRYFIDWSVVLN